MRLKRMKKERENKKKDHEREQETEWGERMRGNKKTKKK